MDLARTVAVVTPERAALEFELAGPGSRFAALLLDTLLQLLLLAVVGGVAAGLLYAAGRLPTEWSERGLRASRLAIAVAVVLSGLVFWGYHILFEVLRGGQTPGKRALGLRVIRDGGHGVQWTESTLRNVLRAVDILPGFAPYLLGALVMVFSQRFRRVGDVVAGTLVIRVRPTPWIETLIEGGTPAAEVPGVRLTAAQLERVTAEEIEVVGRFLQRRETLPLEARRGLARSVAEPLRERTGSARGLTESADVDESWLETLHAAWTRRRRRL
jgi:uncharacterized RDD family membrane protein YckC